METEETPFFITSSKILISWGLLVITVVIGVWQPTNVINIIPAILLPFFIFISSFFTKYKLFESHCELGFQFKKYPIDYSTIKYVKKENSLWVGRFLAGYPKYGFRVRYNKYDDLTIYPKNEEIITLLEKKIEEFKPSEKNKEIYN